MAQAVVRYRASPSVAIEPSKGDNIVDRLDVAANHLAVAIAIVRSLGCGDLLHFLNMAMFEAMSIKSRKGG